MTTSATLQDSALIEGTLAGRSECFTVLMNRHMPAVRRRVKSMVRNTSDEDDLVQETFLNAWRHLSSFRSDASFRTWITRVATNEVLQQYRRNRRSAIAPAVTDLEACASHEETPYQALARMEAHQTVRTAIARLPEKYRRVLVLRDLDELTTHEAARCLESGIPLVKSRHFRARRMLSRAILGRSARLSSIQ
jgi:RNA polymerase sigma factor (sigma-70 family)